MLTDRERRTLREIERGLAVDAPGLAEMMRTRRMRRTVNWPRLAYDAVAAVAVLAAVGCALLGVLGSAAVAALFASVVITVRYLRFAPTAGGPTTPRRRPGPDWRSGGGRPGGRR
jgi:hypothetical protein